MLFAQKADYAGPFDEAGVPLLDYGGSIGLAYNPIAVAQFALGNHSLLGESDHLQRRAKLKAAADWLVENLTPNAEGLPVWMHRFDWDYRETLKDPWFSGLAQGQGVSALLRAHGELSDERYLSAAHEASRSLFVPLAQGGVLWTDAGESWIEEYIVSPPTHILNGAIWAAWGLLDLGRAGREDASVLFSEVARTIGSALSSYDTGYWSLYEQSGTWLPMLASAFYHQLHVVQLDAMHAMTGDARFADYAARWRSYLSRPYCRRRAGAGKLIFKLVHY